MTNFNISLAIEDNILTASPKIIKIGSQLDHLSQQIVFLRPKSNDEDDIILYFSTENKILEPINIGKTNIFVLENYITQYLNLNLQIAFIHSGKTIEHSNKIEIILRPSVYNNTTILPSLHEQIKDVSELSFATVEQNENVLSFKNISGELLGSAIINTQEPKNLIEITEKTKVLGISDNKLLGVENGKIIGIDRSSSYKNIGFQFIGDSLTASSLASSTISKISSNNSGKTTISLTAAPGSALLVGEKITIVGITPKEFNGDFIIEEKPNNTTYVVLNSNVGLELSGTSMWSSGTAPRVIGRVSNSFGYASIAAILCENRPPFLRIDASTGSKIEDWSHNLETYVHPFNAKYIHILLGTNNIGDAGQPTSAINEYKNMLLNLQSRGYKIIVGTLPPKSTNSSANAISGFNQWLKSYALSNGILCVDYFKVLVDPATGLGKSDLFADSLHPNNTGYYIMAKALAITLNKEFEQETYLPTSSAENILSGLNLFDDPVITKAPVASTQSRVTGYYGADTYITTSNSTNAVASVQARNDGCGNDVCAHITFGADVSSSYIQFKTTRATSYTAIVDCVIMPIISLAIKTNVGSSALKQQVYFLYTKNSQASRTTTMLSAPDTYQTSFDDGINYVVKGYPVYLKAGDIVNSSELRVQIYGSGETNVKVGRIAAKIIPLEQFIY